MKKPNLKIFWCAFYTKRDAGNASGELGTIKIWKFTWASSAWTLVQAGKLVAGR
jgi:hypothetical protein